MISMDTIASLLKMSKPYGSIDKAAAAWQVKETQVGEDEVRQIMRDRLAVMKDQPARRTKPGSPLGLRPCGR